MLLKPYDRRKIVTNYFEHTPIIGLRVDNEYQDNYYLFMLTSGDLKSIENVVEKVVDGKINPFYKEFKEYKKLSIEWFEAIFDDLQGKHQEMRELKSKVSRLEKTQPIIT